VANGAENAYSVDVAQYKYRKIFGLSAAEMQSEPADQFFINLKIHAEIEKKKALEANHS
jgi:hypothetical protein